MKQWPQFTLHWFHHSFPNHSVDPWTVFVTISHAFIRRRTAEPCPPVQISWKNWIRHEWPFPFGASSRRHRAAPRQLCAAVCGLTSACRQIDGWPRFKKCRRRQRGELKEEGMFLELENSNWPKYILLCFFFLDVNYILFYKGSKFRIWWNKSLEVNDRDLYSCLV